MRQIVLDLEYFRIEELIRMIDSPHKELCLRILNDNHKLFETAPGSTHNHQAWPGGYIDHVTDGMNFAKHLYSFIGAFGRPVPFSLSDALLIFFLHDLEKPWRILIEKGGARNRKGLDTKAAHRAFREEKLKEYGLVLTEMQHNALAYVEGESKEYKSTERVMNELAAFCHMVDVQSARIWFDYPKAEHDTWTGASRSMYWPK